MPEPSFDREKFEDVVHYICANCRAERLGRTKLHKTLYYFDMVSYALRGTAGTGATYRKQQFGPVAQPLSDALRNLQRDGRLEIGEEEYFGLTKAVYRARQAAPLSRLSNEDVSLLNDVIDWVCNSHNAREISELSHNLAWDAVEFGEVIPYRSAFLILPVDVPDDAMEWAQQEADSVEAWPPELLDAQGLRDFRSRIHPLH